MKTIIKIPILPFWCLGFGEVRSSIKVVRCPKLLKRCVANADDRSMREDDLQEGSDQKQAVGAARSYFDPHVPASRVFSSNDLPPSTR